HDQHPIPQNINKREGPPTARPGHRQTSARKRGAEIGSIQPRISSRTSSQLLLLLNQRQYANTRIVPPSPSILLGPRQQNGDPPPPLKNKTETPPPIRQRKMQHTAGGKPMIVTPTISFARSFEAHACRNKVAVLLPPSLSKLPRLLRRPPRPSARCA
ncbi:unnamed protein product, partial [Ectocarpus sp. 13 AM-2016]